MEQEKFNQAIKLFEKGLAQLEVDSKPLWGKMTAQEMLTHLLYFNEISLGQREVSLTFKIFGLVVGKILLRYLHSINFDTKKFPHNSKTAKDFLLKGKKSATKPLAEIKQGLIETLQSAQARESEFSQHPFYGRIKTATLREIIFFHTKYHLEQFDVMK